MTTKVSSANHGVPQTFWGSLATFYHRRWLLRYFVQRQVTRNYRKSFLGVFWAFLGPLAIVVLLTIVFSKGLGLRFRLVEGDHALNFGLYLFCGTLPFQAYSEAMSKGLNSIRGNSGLIEKVIFPLELLPFTTTITILINKFFSLLALLLVLFVLDHRFEWTVIVLPLIIIPQTFFNMGLGYLASIVGTYLPDISEILRVFVRGTFFITPILWPADRVSQDSPFRPVIDYNPLAYLVATYRGLILEGELPKLVPTLLFSAFAVALSIVGFALFVRFKSKFVELL